MAFRDFKRVLEPGKAERVLTAGADDVAVEVRSVGFGGVQSSAGFSFSVGGEDIEKTGGLHCFSGEWSSDLSEGDEVWLLAAEPPEFASGVPVTVLVRSVNRG